jgi:cellulose synthase/poly-beta-1,6-N-acetylglucosamine synthase-like glycosyltransferase
VVERHDLSLRGKGPALDWFLKNHVQALEEYDVIVFIDADMFVDSQFLAALDAIFTEPAVEVAQGRNIVANPTDSFLAAFGFMSFAWVNHLRPAGRCWLGGTSGLKGSGMAFRSELILRTGWPATSIAEDLEFGKELVLRNTRVHYVPDAVVTSDIGGHFKQVTTQQSRWEGGKARVTLQYLPRLAKRLGTGSTALLFDELFDSLVPPLSVVAALIFVGGLACWWAGATLLILPFAFMALAFGASVLSALWQIKVPAKVLVLLAAAPVFILFKLALLAKLAVTRRTDNWKRTPRDVEKP